MTERIDSRQFACMIAAAARRIREQHAELSRLDSAGGDGDHGSTMLRVVDSLEKAFKSGGAGDLRAELQEAGWNVLSVDGGASSALLGTFFLGMSEAPAQGGTYCCQELGAAFEAGLEALRKQTKAQPGDKTMMDALVPAVAAFRAAADAGENAVKALSDAAHAGRAGAASTANLIARFGRAKLLGEKTRGFQDPGATSMALLFEGFHTGLAGSKGDAGNA
jgi:phosphoenolpyruvate---glycerone phosphotransferase subunit DhaL